ncbi:MAG: hypothetical protein F9K46_02655 [Anaerolineae bacterium]|nr:MAG: hypothetical protein F9K46_02655 [Anaerolineae bacterium]
MKYDIEKNLRTLRAMVEALTPYVYEEELFGHLGDNMPKMTVGGLLLRLHQLEGLQAALNKNQQTQLAETRQKFEQMRYEWRTHYEKKVLQELRSRAETSLRYLQDATDAMGDWGNQIEKRTIIAELMNEASAQNIVIPAELKGLVSEADGFLRRYFKAGGFFWDERFANAYPQETYWWLYGKPNQTD